MGWSSFEAREAQGKSGQNVDAKNTACVETAHNRARPFYVAAVVEKPWNVPSWSAGFHNRCKGMGAHSGLRGLG